MANGDLIKLGTLYMGGTRIPRPTKPWRNSTEPYTGAGVGNIQNYSVGATIEIRNTETNYEMQWVEVNDGGKKYLVCDRVMLVNISWDDLNAQQLVTGKTVTIDGQQYKLRLLTGGSNFRSGSDTHSGGSPASNEWDRWIVNEAGLSGLPTPSSTDLDRTLDSTDLNSPHNQKWNWMGVYSWAQDTWTGDSASRALRGHSSARGWDYDSSGRRYANVGWRPVLEPVLEIDDRIKFTLKNPIETSIAAKKIVVSGVVTVPTGATLSVKACNNGFDASPTWEDITRKFLNREAHTFANTTKTAAKWGINIQFEILKGTATEQIIVDGFGFSFE